MTNFDHFELKVELLEPNIAKSATLPGAFVVRQSILINDELIAADFEIDLFQLAKSCQLSGEFFIFVCQCGEAGCVGIDDGVKVSQLDERIVWEIPDPLSYRGMSRAESDFVSEHREYRTFQFQPDEYMQAVQNGLAKVRAFIHTGDVKPIEYLPAVYNQASYMELDPIVFSKRGAPLGCKILGRNFKISKSPGWVTINGISYRLRELPVTDEIKALDDWSDWEPKPWKNGYLYNYAAAPESERQRRIELLDRYLASLRPM